MKDLAMHVMDIARNSVEAGAALVEVSFRLDKTNGKLEVGFKDNGCGMDADMVQRVTDPFTTTRTTRKVGLGLPLLKMSAQQTGGSLDIRSEKGKGTQVTTVFNVHHIDCVPPGDLSGTATLLIAGNPGVDFRFEFNTGEEAFAISTPDIREALETMDINQPAVVKFIREMIAENLNAMNFTY